MKYTKIASLILSVLMLAAVLCTVAMADDDFTLSKDYITSTGDKGVLYNSPEEKLATMGIKDEATGENKPNFENDEYEIWAHAETGEVGIKVKATGQIILTNPYDVSQSTANEAVKQKLLSQIVIQYKDSSGAIVEFNSYKDAALNGKVVRNQNIGQIQVKNTRTGIRVEYTLGKEQAKYVVPKQIEKESFEKNLIEQWEDKSARDFAQFVAYYDLKDPFDKSLAPAVLTSMKAQFPATENYAIYVLDPGVSNRELEMLSGYIENNTDYDAEQMAADYELIDYIDTSAAPAIFRFAIEYSLDENGIMISMPANSITYDSSNYTLVNVKLLPYLSAGNNDNTGFTLLPDGSGTITRFEDIKGKPFTLTGKVYGKDYSYHSIAGYNQETMRIPAFGIIENRPETALAPVVEEVVEETAEEVTEEAAEGEENTEEAAVEAEAEAEVEAVADVAPAEEAADADNLIGQGFVAYFVDGDSLTELSSDHGGGVHNYSSVYATFYPKATDTYSLTGISSTGDAEWSVSGDRKYVGDYSMRLFPVYGKDVDYTDMAEIVRNYLEKTEVLTRLTPENDKSEDVALYIENFGTIKTDEKILGFPTKLQTPLTTFEQTQDIITNLKERGVDNINVKLTGWYNGGMEHTAPSTLSVPGKIGGMGGLKKLAAFAKENGVGLYPDLDFTYVEYFKSFDGLSVKDDTVKTLDGRGAVHRVYNALYQGFEEDDKAVISPGSISELYEKINKKYKKIGAGGISVASIGYDLNSDHNDEYVLNRDESQELVEDFLKTLEKENGSVMVDGGNAYSLGYADHILSVPLESSMNINTSQSVPFMGMILHGYVEFAGTPINLDGDYDYSVLKAIENGASLYYVVSKDNTSELKAFPEFSKYYAISYDNWANDIESTYASFNGAMKGVKYSLIDEHEYLGTRLVRVKYDNGTEFILNYNTHDVTTEDGTTVEAMSFAVR
ncbi:MAG: hypothetical protein J6E38_03240 [Clostridia bacterium]|nr:hypothetical protein [Clostridia bacterium]